MIRIEAPQAAYVQHVIENLRSCDRDEIFAATGHEPAMEIEKALARPGRHYCALIGREPIALYGVADMNGFSRIGSPWLVGTDAVARHGRSFLRQSRRNIGLINEGYDYLVNMVDRRNTASILWLQWLGFTIHTAQPYGPFGQMFHKFDMAPCPPLAHPPSPHAIHS